MKTQSLTLNSYSVTFVLEHIVISTTCIGSCEESARENATYMIADELLIPRHFLDSASEFEAEIILEDI